MHRPLPATCRQETGTSPTTPSSSALNPQATTAAKTATDDAGCNPTPSATTKGNANASLPQTSSPAVSLADESIADILRTDSFDHGDGRRERYSCMDRITGVCCPPSADPDGRGRCFPPITCSVPLLPQGALSWFSVWFQLTYVLLFALTFVSYYALRQSWLSWEHEDWEDFFRFLLWLLLVAYGSMLVQSVVVRLILVWPVSTRGFFFFLLLAPSSSTALLVTSAVWLNYYEHYLTLEMLGDRDGLYDWIQHFSQIIFFAALLHVPLKFARQRISYTLNRDAYLLAIEDVRSKHEIARHLWRVKDAGLRSSPGDVEGSEKLPFSNNRKNKKDRDLALLPDLKKGEHGTLQKRKQPWISRFRVRRVPDRSLRVAAMVQDLFQECDPEKNGVLSVNSLLRRRGVTLEVAHRAFEWFQRGNETIVVERHDVQAALMEYWMHRDKLHSVLHRFNNVSDIVRTMLLWLWGFLVIILIFFVLGANLDGLLVTGGTILLSVSLVFGQTLRKLVDGVIFVAAAQSFDVGDRIHIGAITNPPYWVVGVNLWTTHLRDTYGRVSAMPNEELAKHHVVNLKRSPRAWIEMIIWVDFQTPTNALKALHSSICEFTLRRPNQWASKPVDMFIGDIKNLSTMELSFWAQHVKDHSRRVDLFRSKGELTLFVRDMCNKLGIAWHQPSLHVMMNDDSRTRVPEAKVVDREVKEWLEGDTPDFISGVSVQNTEPNEDALLAERTPQPMSYVNAAIGGLRRHRVRFESQMRHVRQGKQRRPNAWKSADSGDGGSFRM